MGERVGSGDIGRSEKRVTGRIKIREIQGSKGAWRVRRIRKSWGNSGE